MSEIKRLLNSLLWEIYGRIPWDISQGRNKNRYLKMYPRLYELKMLERLSVKVLNEICDILRLEIRLISRYLERVLISRDKNRTQQTILYGFLDIIVSSRLGESSREMRFNLSPTPGAAKGHGGLEQPVIVDETDSLSDFNQWLHAMKMVARLPGGMPPEFRRKLWLALAEKYLKSKNVDWEKEELKCFSEQWREDDVELGIQIVKDLHRTGSSLCSGPAGTINQAKLKRILLGYARYNPEVGYCQGFNMLGALILQVMDKEEIESIKVMIYLVEGILPQGYFSGSLGGLQADMAVFRELMTCKLPRLAKHLQKLQGPVENAYEPPLTNVFTMQWFLTMFCTCLPMTCVLRVWDLVLIEGSDVLLRTALVLWSLLEERILNAKTADDFYCKMGSFSSELLNGHLIDSNGLVERVVELGPIADLQKLRDKHLYNISPFRNNKGLQLYYSDEEGDSDEDSRMAVATAWGLRLSRRGSAGLSNKTDSKDRIALDISLLKKQYDRLRERQRQAHIILTSAVARQGSNPNQSSIQMNQLLIGRNAILTNNGRRLGPPQGAIPPARKPTSEAKSPKTTHSKPTRHGETLHWRDTDISRRRRGSLKWKDIKSDSSQSASGKDERTSQLTGSAHSSRSSSSEPTSQRTSAKPHQRNDSSSYSEDSDGNSSTSTSLCDEDEHEVGDLNASSIEESPVRKAKGNKKHPEVPHKKCLEDVLNSNEKQYTVDSQIPFIQLTTMDSPVPNANKTDIDAIEYSKEDSETESNRLGYAGFVEEFSWTDLKDTDDNEPATSIAVDITSNEGLLALSKTIMSTSQLSPIPDIPTYITNSSISPLRTPISAFDFKNVASIENNSKQFNINDEGVTNEYFERVNVVERPTKLDLLYSLNEEDSIRNAFLDKTPSYHPSPDHESLKDSSSLESSLFLPSKSSTRNIPSTCQEIDRKMKVLLEYSNQSSLSFIAEAKHEISLGKFKDLHSYDYQSPGLLSISDADMKSLVKPAATTSSEFDTITESSITGYSSFMGEDNLETRISPVEKEIESTTDLTDKTLFKEKIVGEDSFETRKSPVEKETHVQSSARELSTDLTDKAFLKEKTVSVVENSPIAERNRIESKALISTIDIQKTPATTTLCEVFQKQGNQVQGPSSDVAPISKINQNLVQEKKVSPTDELPTEQKEQKNKSKKKLFEIDAIVPLSTENVVPENKVTKPSLNELTIESISTTSMTEDQNFSKDSVSESPVREDSQFTTHRSIEHDALVDAKSPSLQLLYSDDHFGLSERKTVCLNSPPTETYPSSIQTTQLPVLPLELISIQIPSPTQSPLNYSDYHFGEKNASQLMLKEQAGQQDREPAHQSNNTDEKQTTDSAFSSKLPEDLNPNRPLPPCDVDQDFKFTYSQLTCDSTNQKDQFKSLKNQRSERLLKIDNNAAIEDSNNENTTGSKTKSISQYPKEDSNYDIGLNTETLRTSQPAETQAQAKTITKHIPSTADLEHRFRELERKLSIPNMVLSTKQGETKSVKSPLSSGKRIIPPVIKTTSENETDLKLNEEPVNTRKRIPSTEDLESRFNALEIEKTKSPTIDSSNLKVEALVSPQKIITAFGIKKQDIPSIEDLEHRFLALEQNKLIKNSTTDCTKAELTTKHQEMEYTKAGTNTKGIIDAPKDKQLPPVEINVSGFGSTIPVKCSSSSFKFGKVLPSTQDLEARFEQLTKGNVSAKKTTGDVGASTTNMATSNNYDSLVDKCLVPDVQKQDLQNVATPSEQASPVIEFKKKEDNTCSINIDQQNKKHEQDPKSLETEIISVIDTKPFSEPKEQESKYTNILQENLEMSSALEASSSSEDHELKKKEPDLSVSSLDRRIMPVIEDISIDREQKIQEHKCGSKPIHLNVKLTKHILENNLENAVLSDIPDEQIQNRKEEQNNQTNESTAIVEQPKRKDLYKLESQSDETLTSCDQNSFKFESRPESRPTSCPENRDPFDVNVVTTDRVLKIIEENSKILHRILKKTLADTGDVENCPQSNKSDTQIDDSLSILDISIPSNTDSISPNRIISHSWLRPSFTIRSDDNISDRLASIKNTIKSIDTLCEEKSFHKEKCQRYIDSLFSSPSKTNRNSINPLIRVEELETQPSQERISKREPKKDVSPRRRRNEEREEYESRVRRDMMPNNVDICSDHSFSNIVNTKHVDREVDSINQGKQAEIEGQRSVSPYYCSSEHDLNKRSITPVVYIPTKLEIRHTTVTSTFYDRYLIEKEIEKSFPRSKKPPMSPTLTKSYLEISSFSATNLATKSSKSAENSPSRRGNSGAVSPNNTIATANKKRNLLPTLDDASNDLHIRSCDNILLQMKSTTNNKNYNPLPIKLHKPPEVGINLGLYKDYNSDESSKS